MRPVRIEVEGFSAYRSAVSVDLSRLLDSDLPFFSLSGATGAGKSSLIDAMIFALYGRIPRLGGTAVAPVISAGTDRARVRFDFDVDGVIHTAVRLAQRTPSGGATVKEARLERGDEVLADGADNVTTAVEELLRLGFDDFTRTVVLPQGDFARFLNATKAERQALLRGILGLEVYGRVRELAGGRQAVASDRASGAHTRLDALEVPAEADIEGASARLSSLEAMVGQIRDREQALAVLALEVGAATADVTRLTGARERLEVLAPPEDLDELGEMVTLARSTFSDAEEAHAAAVAGGREIEKRLEGIPEPETIALGKHDYQSLDQVETQLEALADDRPRQALEEAETRLAESRQAHLEAVARRNSLHISHTAHAIGATLVVGENCPVCQRRVEVLPVAETPPELTRVEKELETSEARVEADLGAVGLARAAITEHETTRANLAATRDTLVARLSGAPNREELARLETLATELKDQLAGSRRTVSSAEETLGLARKQLDEMAARQHAMGRLLTTAQLKVADLSPPVSESDDVVVQWKDLMTWRAETLDRVVEEHAALLARSAEALSAHDSAREELVADLATAGLDAIEPYSATLASEVERARHVVAHQQKTLVDANALSAEIDSETANADVAAALAGHLKANGFEQWLMAGALETLVVGANDLLAQLSEGGYSLHSQEGSFTIVDHRNADEKRSVSTLSGGETFLVSLALALSLAETLASAGGARLDAIILDEGFGTLDDESLDTVASVLEELAGKGLMVGVITHVKELASRAAVRFEVTREARGSTVSDMP